MAGGTGILMDANHNTFDWDGVANGALGASGKMVGAMTAMGDIPIGMTIETADREGIVLDNSLYAGIPGLDVSRTGRVVTLGAAAAMEGEDAIGTLPGVSEQRVGGMCCSTALVAAVAVGAIRFIRAPH